MRGKVRGGGGEWREMVSGNGRTIREKIKTLRMSDWPGYSVVDHLPPRWQNVSAVVSQKISGEPQGSVLGLLRFLFIFGQVGSFGYFILFLFFSEGDISVVAYAFGI